MKLTSVLIPISAAVALLTSVPASAQWRGNYYDNTYTTNGYQTQRNFYGAPQGSGWNHGGWNGRNVNGSDPSFSNRAGINSARRTGRCVVDLGYGRYEYCGW